MASLQLPYPMAHTRLVIILGPQHRACINFRSLLHLVVALGLRTRKLVHKRHSTGISLQSSSLATHRPLGARHHLLYKPSFPTISRLQRTQTVRLSMLTSGHGLRKNRPSHPPSLLYIVDPMVGAGLWIRYWTTETEQPTFTSVGFSRIPPTTCWEVMEHDLDQLSARKQSSKCPIILAKGKEFHSLSRQILVLISHSGTGLSCTTTITMPRIAFVHSSSLAMRQSSQRYGETFHESSHLNILIDVQESHNQRLKALSDKNNTNLYVSNLPRLMVEKVCVAYGGYFSSLSVVAGIGFSVSGSLSGGYSP